mmetsp:Transcript_37236/g.112411  ORF Transcript_37236/g.112411 Transcript_37236/m.112411 type:complete len:217 (+) Transcript_37236:192-842(+)
MYVSVYTLLSRSLCRGRRSFGQSLTLRAPGLGASSWTSCAAGRRHRRRVTRGRKWCWPGGGTRRRPQARRRRRPCTRRCRRRTRVKGERALREHWSGSLPERRASGGLRLTRPGSWRRRSGRKPRCDCVVARLRPSFSGATASGWLFTIHGACCSSAGAGLHGCCSAGRGRGSAVVACRRPRSRRRMMTSCWSAPWSGRAWSGRTSVLGSNRQQQP